MEENISKLCRACMKDLTVPSSIYFTSTTKEIGEKFTLCTNIKTTPEDGLPQNFCYDCSNLITTLHKFIHNCHKVDVTLKNIVSRVETSVIVSSSIRPPTIDPSDDGEKCPLESNFVKRAAFEGSDEGDGLHSLFCDDGPIEENKNDGVGLETEEEKSSEKLETDEPDEVQKKKRVRKKIIYRKCPVCRYQFESKKLLRLHLLMEHIDYKEFVCSYCPKGFVRAQNLQQHLAIHTNDRPFACEQCGKAYKQRGQLNTHRKLHANERPFKCDQCDKSFKLKNVLASHMLIHAGLKPHLCHLCGQGFALAGNLAVHMRMHTGDKPFRCEHCAFSCSVASSLRRHLRSHTGARPHACATCGKMFNASGGLARHTRIHTGELPYKCQYCPRAFIDSWKRKSHIVKDHNVPMEDIPLMGRGRKSAYQKERARNS